MFGGTNCDRTTSFTGINWTTMAENVINTFSHKVKKFVFLNWKYLRMEFEDEFHLMFFNKLRIRSIILLMHGRKPTEWLIIYIIYVLFVICICNTRIETTPYNETFNVSTHGKETLQIFLIHPNNQHDGIEITIKIETNNSHRPFFVPHLVQTCLVLNASTYLAISPSETSYIKVEPWSC